MDKLVLVPAPTPIDAAPRLAAALGLAADDLLIKRDDLIGLGGGGNKVRKLEYSCAEALRAGATTLVTTGAPQSNHARLTAAAGARLGLDVVLVLDGDDPGSMRGNLLLNALFGARVVFSGGVAATLRADELVHELADQGTAAYRIPFGGTSSTTARGYADAARELLGQVGEVDQVVVAAGSGGTMAGLVSVLGPDRVLGVDCGAVPDPRATVAGLLAGMPASGTPGAGIAAEEIDPGRLRIDLRQIGRGYAHLSATTRQAMELFARTEGLLVDATYTGRAAAGLVAACADGTLRAGQRVVFWHTGGLPGLFGHPDL